MADEPAAMREIHEIRERIARETAHMMPEEHAAHANRIAERLARKHGFTLLQTPAPLQHAL